MYLGLREEHPELDDRRRQARQHRRRTRRRRRRVFTLQQLEADADDDSARQELDAPPDPDEPFVIVYTSGTTSRPKGCVHTFNTYCAGSRALVGPFGYTEADVQFGPSPIAHTTGLVTSVLVPMLTGASTHVMAKWDPARGVDEIQRFGCTAAVTATTFLQTLLSGVRRRAPRPVHACGCGHVRARRSRRRSFEQASASTARTSRCSASTGAAKTSSPPHVRSPTTYQRALTSDGTALPVRTSRSSTTDGNEVPRGTEGDIAYRGPPT